MKNITVGVIFGGPSEEYEVSCNSAKNIVAGLKEAGYDVVPIGISREGRWYAPVPQAAIASFDAKSAGVAEVTILPRPGGELICLSDQSVLATLDVVFPIIHGTFGEDGRLQGFLDMCRLPYVGAGTSGSVVGMDKVYMRDILAAHGIAQTEYAVVMRSDWQEAPEQVLDAIEEKLRHPVFVKPANGGSSVGISRANNRTELSQALNEAAAYDRKLLVERAVNKREIELAVLGNDVVQTSYPGEVLADQDFYDYRAKYQSAVSRTEVPVQLPAERIEEIRAMGARIYRILDLWGLCRVDFFLEKETDRLLLNEVNTLPGFTEISMYSKMWAASGKPLPALLDELVQLALAHFADVSQNRITPGGVSTNG